MHYYAKPWLVADTTTSYNGLLLEIGYVRVDLVKHEIDTPGLIHIDAGWRKFTDTDLVKTGYRLDNVQDAHVKLHSVSQARNHFAGLVHATSWATWGNAGAKQLSIRSPWIHQRYLNLKVLFTLRNPQHAPCSLHEALFSLGLEFEGDPAFAACRAHNAGRVLIELQKRLTK